MYTLVFVVVYMYMERPCRSCLYTTEGWPIYI